MGSSTANTHQTAGLLGHTSISRLGAGVIVSRGWIQFYVRDLEWAGRTDPLAAHDHPTVKHWPHDVVQNLATYLAADSLSVFLGDFNPAKIEVNRSEHTFNDVRLILRLLAYSLFDAKARFRKK